MDFNMKNVTMNNVTSNGSVVTYRIPPLPDESIWLQVVPIMRTICVPLITGVGFLGNMLTLLVFSAKSMKKSSCSVFLASLAFVDNIFLLSLLLTWIDGEIRVILTSDISCQLIIFSTYVTSFLSVWFIVGFTCERFIAICFPLKCNYMCSVFREKVVVVILVITASVMYNFSFWTAGVQQWGQHLRCSHKIQFFQFLNIVTWIDTLFTMVAPFFFILFMNSMVVYTVIQCPKKKNGRALTKVNSSTLLNSTNSTTKPKGIKCRIGYQRQNPQVRVTRTLLFVSTTFLFLNLPSHVIRLYNLIMSVTTDNQEVSAQFYFLQELTLMLYYTTFSCNFFLYTCFGRNFKKSLIRILRCRSTMETNRAKVLRKLSSTQGSCVTSL